MSKYKSPLHEMAMTTPTDFWNDSCSFDELKYAIEHGAVGATTNPVIVGNVLKKEMHLWEDRIRQLVKDNPVATEEDIAWALNEEMAVEAGKLLLPIFEKEKGKKGRISIQTNAMYYRDWKKMADQAVHFGALAPNMQVKMPVTAAGIKAFEEATYQGVSINATVSFTVAQAVQVAEAVQRGLDRRKAEGKDTSTMSPVCTIMVGRLDDWLRVNMNKHKVAVDPGYLEWAGIAAFKRAYEIYQEKGYETRLLSAAYRNPMQWSEFVGGEVSMTITSDWQKRINASGLPVENRMDKPVDPHIIKVLEDKFPEFVKGYEPNGLTIEEFDSYGATVRTLRGFIQGYQEYLGVMREFMLPNPDK
ncbi:MAG: transaldolase family protein [Sphaerochaetaceae bacterium]|jgi:transaldolase